MGLGAKFKERWLLILFALPFAGVGVGMLILSVLPSMTEAWQMRSWHQGQAYLSSAGVDKNRSDDSTTYRARATYTYEYNGRRYSGSRVAISESSDNIGDFHQRVGRRLERAHRDKRPVPVWINPANPGEAVLNRELRWGKIGFSMIFVIVFGGVGLGLLGFCLLARSDKVPGAQAGDKPWLARREWLGPAISSDGKATLWVAWFFAVIWNGFAFPIMIPISDEIRGGNNAAWIALLFPAVGIALLVWAINASRNWRRFGKTPLTMDPYPGSIGGQVGGTIDLRLPYDTDAAFKTTLSCLYSYMSGSGKDRKRRERLVWQTEGFAHTSPGAQGTRLDILFDVDDELPASDLKDSSSYHLWRLHVEAKLPGADYDRSFEIPVFPTAEQALGLRALSSEHEKAEEHRLQSIEDVLDIRQLPGGVELYCPAFKRPGAKLVGIICGVVFFGGGVAVARAEGMGFFPGIFLLVGGGIFLVSVYSLCLSIRVRIESHRLEIAKWFLGFPLGKKSIPRGEVRRLLLKESYSSSSGHKHTRFFKIQAETVRGKCITVAYNLTGRNTAEQALESLSLLTAIPTEGDANSQGVVRES